MILDSQNGQNSQNGQKVEMVKTILLARSIGIKLSRKFLYVLIGRF